MTTIQVIKNTVLKIKPLPSTRLSATEKRSIAKGETLEVSSVSKVGRHFEVCLNGKKWYLYEGHVNILSQNRTTQFSDEIIKLDVPYKSQLDNKYRPHGTCSVTSIAMALEYLEKDVKRDADRGQLEDELFQYALRRGYDYQNPYDLARIVRDYGYQDVFKEDATIEEVQGWLRDGNPVVIHGYFTRVGHIVTVVGFDSEGFFVHDPYGEWFSTGYRTDLSGEYLHYSYRLIRRTCIPDGSFWVHFISR